MTYRVILADPPWSYRAFKPGTKTQHPHNGEGDRRRRLVRAPVAVRYDVLAPDDLHALPVAAMAEKNAALFMWATMPCLPEALALIEAWGFTYRTVAFTWVKTTRAGGYIKGLGHYTMPNAELCLLGIHGSMRRKAADVSQLIGTARREHSRKPDEQYERIMRLFDGPYLELFARQQWPGWDVWGNQAGKFPAQPFLIPESAVS